MLECTVVGGFTTIWMGTAFDCPGQGDVIDLRHSQFESGIKLKCNNGMIIGHSHNRTFDGPTDSTVIHFSTDHPPAITECYKQQTGGGNCTVHS